MASGVYNQWKAKNGTNWTAGAASAYKVMLVTNSYTPNPDHTFPNATGLAANEVTGGSYARQDLPNRAATKDDSNDRFDHSADNVVFTALAGPAAPRYAIVYRAVTADTDHELVAWIDLGAGLSVTGDFTVKWNGGTSSGVVFRHS